jgi:flagellar protein FliS
MFPANSRTAMNAYRNVGVASIVDSATPQQLILMLYHGATAAIASAQQHLRLKNIAAKGEAISKAISIIDGGLKASLDLSVGGELAQNLSDLYAYMAQRLLQANIKNDAKALDEVALLLEQLGQAWETIAAKTRSAQATASTAATPAAAPASRAAAASPSPTSRLAAAYGAI